MLNEESGDDQNIPRGLILQPSNLPSAGKMMAVCPGKKAHLGNVVSLFVV